MSKSLYEDMTTPSRLNKAYGGFMLGAMGCIAAPFVLLIVGTLIAMIYNAIVG